MTIPGSGRRKSYYGKTKAEALAKLSAGKRDLERGLVPVGDERQTVAQYLASWLETIAPSLAQRTVGGHRDYVRLYLAPHLGHVRLSVLSAQHVQTLYTRLLAAGLSTTTVRHAHTTLHKALSDALRLGLVPRNVAEAVTPPRERRVEMHTLTSDEVRQLLEEAAGTQAGALYALAVTAGLRQGELLGLHWAQVDLDAGALQVTSNLQYDRAAHALAVGAPKTARSRRRIALSPEIVAELREQRQRQREARLFVGPAWEAHDLVFCGPTGRPLQAPTVWRQFQRDCRAAGLPRVRFHDLRHTCATLLLRANVPVKVVSELLGHSSVSITLDVYAHVTPDMQAAAAAVMGKLVYGG